jgi:hypothetical protein
MKDTIYDSESKTNPGAYRRRRYIKTAVMDKRNMHSLDGASLFSATHPWWWGVLPMKFLKTIQKVSLMRPTLAQMLSACGRVVFAG